MALQTQTLGRGFTIGICASDLATKLPDLLDFLSSEDYGEGFELRKVVVVASQCPESVLVPVRSFTATNPRFSLIEEPRRRGKAEAINRIMRASSGEFLVIVNADAFPTPGSIRRLLEIARDGNVGAVSAQPVFGEGEGLLQRGLALMWSAHSLMSLRLNHAGVSNHACDELILVRRELVNGLPVNLVNDGAYIGGLVRSRGHSVKFSTEAKVRIAVPHRPADLIRQRRRIIFGHVQVWKKLGRPPRTMESMLFMDPLTSLRTFVKTLAERPSFILTFPFVAATESIAVLAGVADAVRSTDAHAVWRRNVD